MSELARIGLVAGALAVALAVSWWARVRMSRRGAPVDVTGLLSGPGAVVFTKDECATCAATLDRVEALGLPLLQVRAEDEPGEFERRGITGVPITVIVDREARRCGQFAGLPKSRALRRAARRAGEIPGARSREL